MTVSNLQNRQSQRYPGLDILRLIAMILVTAQHAIVAATSIECTRLGGTSLGQYGVNLFCAISGFLVFQDQRTVGAWLQRRLMRLYPAYWLTVLFGFAINAFLKYKPASLQLFLLQLAGLGGFANANIVNIAVWFISLILLCYLLAFVARLSRHPVVVMILCVGVFAFLTLKPHGIRLPHVHLLSFCLASLIGLCSQRIQRYLCLSVCLIVIPVIPFQRDITHVMFTFLLIGFCLSVSNVPNRVQGLAGSTYEYFLIHGMCVSRRLAVTSAAVGC